MRASAAHMSSPAPLALAMALCGFAPAHAGEVAYCVTCQGPDQTYLCRVNGDEVRQSDAVKLYCVVRTAEEGGHASCAARNATAACNGIEKHYSYNGPSIANQSPAPSSGTTSSHAAAQEPLPELPHGTATVPLSAAPTESASPPPEHKRGVGSFARNTYRCVRSLFRRCGSDTSEAPN